MRTKRLLLFAVVLSIFAFATAITADAQRKRDNLTPPEIELARDTQALDQRTLFYVIAIQRRFAVLSGNTADPAKAIKLPPESSGWGDMPKGSRAELLSDISGILDEAINRIDDTATRDPENLYMMRAARILGEACNTKIVPQLKEIESKATDPKEKIAIGSALEYAQSIIESMSKVPADLEQKITEKEKAEKKANKKSKDQ